MAKKEDKEAVEQDIVKTSSGSDLIVESDVGPESTEFKPEQSKSINEAVANISSSASTKKSQESWLVAKKKVELFKPLPWFLWRLSLSVFSQPVGKEQINEGMVLGLRRLLFASASDPMLGIGSKVNTVKKALEILPADVVAAVSVVHSVSRRLISHKKEAIWRSYLDEALVQAQIGFELGKASKCLGPGRGLLAGFVGPIGTAILIARGDKKQASEAIEKMSEGISFESIAEEIYGCEPYQISSMLLAACGCGSEASSGIAASILQIKKIFDLDENQILWAAAPKVITGLRNGKISQIEDELIEFFEISATKLDTLQKLSTKVSRSGHSWQWIE